ncbi:uncharacterized protein LOC119672477 [Teleopsis dalmanni]|uniref:uncharacterized protein LOC119672477 n=1 Tax=Teleopsis dalmanni TaxID=139649 RepID=UPI0018CD04D4|nr:uncharacterized protein LOC119672477 [Teleopsis dalmanni]
MSSPIKLPQFSNEEFFIKALKSTYGDDIKINNIEFKLISGSGDNYCSNVYRFHITFKAGTNDETLTETLIVKDLLDIIVKSNTKEFDMYEKVLKKLESIVNESITTADKKIKFAPECYLLTREFGETYVFEDLNAKGYQTVDRWKGLSESQCFATLKKLAEFHAASMIFAKKHPDLIELIKDSHFKNAPNKLMLVIKENIRAGALYTNKLEGYEEIVEKINKNIECFVERMEATVDDADCSFKVINHADLWSPNILVKGTPDDTEDVTFLDFQLCCYSSPGIDLNFLLHTSLPLELMQSKRYEFIRYYYKVLKQTLKDLNMPEIDIPTFDQLMAEVKRTEFYSFYCVLSELPLLCLNPELAKHMSIISFTDTEFMEKVHHSMFDNERVCKTLKYTLDRLNELGILD